MADSPITAIIDAGTGHVRAGLSTDESPAFKFRCHVGIPRKGASDAPDGSLLEPFYFAEQAEELRSQLILKRPVEWGLVTNWDLMEKLWNFTFSQRLCIDPSEHPVAIVEATNTPKANTEKSTQIMFEHFAVPALFIGGHSMVSMLSSGRSNFTGMVLDMGEGSIHPVPIYEGYTMRHAVSRSYMTGGDLQHHLSTLLGFNTTEEYRAVGEAMCSPEMCFVSQDFEADMARPEEDFVRSFKPRFRDEFSLSKQRFQCLEPIFRPELIKLEFPSIPWDINNVIGRCDPQIRKQMWSNLILSGGLSAAPGLAERMTTELQKLAPEEKIKIYTHPHAGNAAWMGLREIASLDDFATKWAMSKAQYDEEGPALATRLFLL